MEVNSRVPAGLAPTGFCYLLKNLGKEKQRGFVTNSQGSKLEAIMYTDPQNKMSVAAWTGADSISRRQKAPFFCVPAICSPFPRWLLGAPWSSPYSQSSVGAQAPKEDAGRGKHLPGPEAPKQK